MRRLAVGVLAGLMLLSGGIVWSFGGNVTAEDDAISILQTQVAALDDRVTALEGGAHDAASPVPVDVLNFTGMAGDITAAFHLSHDAYTVTFTCTDPLGYATIIGAPANADTLFPGKTELIIPAGSYRIDVRCSVAWSLVLVSRSH